MPNTPSPDTSLPADLQAEIASRSHLSPHLMRGTAKKIVEGAADALMDLLGPLKTPVDMVKKAIEAYKGAKEQVERIVFQTKLAYVHRHTQAASYQVPAHLQPVFDDLAGVPRPVTADTALPQDLTAALAPAQAALDALKAKERALEAEAPHVEQADADAFRLQFVGRERQFVRDVLGAVDAAVPADADAPAGKDVEVAGPSPEAVDGVVHEGPLSADAERHEIAQVLAATPAGTESGPASAQVGAETADAEEPLPDGPADLPEDVRRRLAAHHRSIDRNRAFYPRDLYMSTLTLERALIQWHDALREVSKTEWAGYDLPSGTMVRLPGGATIALNALLRAADPAHVPVDKFKDHVIDGVYTVTLPATDGAAPASLELIRRGEHLSVLRNGEHLREEEIEEVVRTLFALAADLPEAIERQKRGLLPRDVRDRVDQAAEQLERERLDTRYSAINSGSSFERTVLRWYPGELRSETRIDGYSGQPEEFLIPTVTRFALADGTEVELDNVLIHPLNRNIAYGKVHITRPASADGSVPARRLTSRKWNGIFRFERDGESVAGFGDGKPDTLVISDELFAAARQIPESAELQKLRAAK